MPTKRNLTPESFGNGKKYRELLCELFDLNGQGRHEGPVRTAFGPLFDEACQKGFVRCRGGWAKLTSRGYRCVSKAYWPPEK